MSRIATMTMGDMEDCSHYTWHPSRRCWLRATFASSVLPFRS
jgi:hypothetical protein